MDVFPVQTMINYKSPMLYAYAVPGTLGSLPGVRDYCERAAHRRLAPPGVRAGLARNIALVIRHGMSACGNRSVTAKTAWISSPRKRDGGRKDMRSANVRGAKPRGDRTWKEIGTGQMAGGLFGQNEKHDKLGGTKRRCAE